MDAFIMHKCFGWLNTYRKPIVTTITIALLIDIFVSNLQHASAAANEPVEISAPAENEIAALSAEIKQLVRELEYSDEVAEDFAKMVMSWKDEEGRPILISWKEKLIKEDKNYDEGKIKKEQLVRLKRSIVRRLSEQIQTEISYYDQFFELGNVVKNKQTDCVGYSQILYVLGNFIGLSVETVEIDEPIIPSLYRENGHIACIISLPNNSIMMADLAIFPKPLISKPFELKKQFIEKGYYWELKDKDNPLEVHRKIRILDKNGLIASIYINKGNAYSQLEYDKAIHNYNQAIQLDPNSANAYFNRGTIYGQLCNYSKALSDLTRAIVLNPEFTEVYCNRGIVYSQLDRYDEAIADYTHAIALEPKSGKAYFNRGNTYIEMKYYNEAILDYNEFIKIDPNYAEAYYNRGTAYSKLRKINEAFSDFNKAIEIDPNYANVYYNRGVEHANLNHLTDALSDFNKVIELNQKDATAYANRGVVYSMLNQPDRAIPDFNKAIELNPELAEVYYNRGNAYLNLGRHNEAIKDFTKTIELEPKNAKAYANRGTAYACLGKPEEAKEDLLKTVRLNSAMKPTVKQISDQFKLGLNLE